MWCGTCQTDVAAELSSDNRRLLCARCQAELGIAAGATDRPTVPIRSLDTERNARELLARWSTQQLLDVPQRPSAVMASVATGESRNPATQSGHAIPKPSYRFDAAHDSVSPPIVASTERKDASGEVSEGSEPRRRRRKKLSRPQIAIPTDDGLPEADEYEELIRMAIQQKRERQGSWTTTIGQLCAYGGVGLLTLGTVMVFSWYFGGPSNYTPTGWLVAAVGQMMLFLGVITLVSGGMEQTIDEVTWRIDDIATRIIHMEQLIQERETRHRRERHRDAKEGRSESTPPDQADAA